MWFQSDKPARKNRRGGGRRQPTVLHLASTTTTASNSAGIPYGALFLFGGVILVIVLWGIWLLFGAMGRLLYADNPQFALETVEARTDGVLPETILVEWSGVHAGDNLFDIDLESVRRKLERNAIIRKALVRRKLPNGLMLVVNERIPIARMGRVEGRMNWLMDGEGVIIKKSFQAKQLPFLVGVIGDVTLGDDISGSKAREALAYLRVLREMPALKRDLLDVSVISVGHPDFLDFRLRDTTQVLLPREGDRRQLLEQATRQIHEARLQGLQLGMFDLRPAGNNKIGAPE